MNPEFDYREVPYGFPHCFRGECPQSSKCLRHIAATHSSAGESYLTIVNPAQLPEGTSPCSFYCKGEKTRVAWGVKNMFDQLPLQQATQIKQTLLSHYGKTQYYRIYRKEYSLSVKEQDYIRRVFRQYGIQDEPAYEYYTEVYQW